MLAGPHECAGLLFTTMFLCSCQGLVDLKSVVFRRRCLTGSLAARGAALQGLVLPVSRAQASCRGSVGHFGAVFTWPGLGRLLGALQVLLNEEPRQVLRQVLCQ